MPPASYADPFEPIFNALNERGWVDAAVWPKALGITPQSVGLQQAGAILRWPAEPELLDPLRIQQALPKLETIYLRSVDSTNTQLLERVNNAGGRLCVAEFQHGGRGRRGRRWHSPYARNLALSLGFETRRDLADLGGLSLVAGLALAEAVSDLGARNVRVKWPNDLLWQGRKLCGILVELVRRPVGADVRHEVIIGAGVNVSLTADDRSAIDQPVTDLREAHVSHSRTELLIALASRLQAALEVYEARGFADFVERFDALHHFHQQSCTLLHGNERITGTVLGVTATGELRLDTASGPRDFSGGEVSLRPS